MALPIWVYRPRENARKSSFSSGGNVAEKTVEVKDGKILQSVGGWWRVVGRLFGQL
jgi:hypothetical protein